jgi:hypothetical protein
MRQRDGTAGWGRRVAAIAALVLTVAGGIGGARANTGFNVTYDEGVPAEMRTAFDAAAANWSALLRDAVTVKVTVGYEALSPGVLGQASYWIAYGDFDAVRNLVAGGGEPGDSREAALLPNLPTASQFSVTLPTGFAFAGTAYLTTANWKALGGDYSGADGDITFSSNFLWDLDPADGVTAGRYDFQGVAMHELGHILGFVSGVDMVDAVLESGETDSDVWVSALDLFRFRTSDLEGSGFDFTTSARYMVPGDSHSFYHGDGSVLLSTGYYNGDGRQASHWKDNLGLGIMDPTAATGEKLAVGANDLMALDLIGWDVIPEPATLALVAVGSAAMLLGRRRRRLTPAAVSLADR